MNVRNLKWCALLWCCLLSSFCIGVTSPAKAADASSKEAVTSLLQVQNDAWNKGDLDTFMTGYLNAPDLSYTSSGKEVWGYEALRDRYQTRYGKSKASMGKLSFSDIRVFDLGAANALAIGHWHLMREGQGEGQSEKLDGTFSLVLVRTDKGWKILHDHTSALK